MFHLLASHLIFKILFSVNFIMLPLFKFRELKLLNHFYKDIKLINDRKRIQIEVINTSNYVFFLLLYPVENFKVAH